MKKYILIPAIAFFMLGAIAVSGGYAHAEKATGGSPAPALTTDMTMQTWTGSCLSNCAATVYWTATNNTSADGAITTCTISSATDPTQLPTPDPVTFSNPGSDSGSWSVLLNGVGYHSWSISCVAGSTSSSTDAEVYVGTLPKPGTP